MSSIRAILIDPYAETDAERVREVQIEGERLKAYYDLIGHDCTMVEAIYPEAIGGECLYVDEEGLWQQYAGFKMHGHHGPLMGRGIIVGTNMGGDTISTVIPLDTVRGAVRGWLMDLNRLAQERQS